MKAMTTITIVMEIITMLNDVVGSSDFLLGICGKIIVLLVELDIITIFCRQ